METEVIVEMETAIDHEGRIAHMETDLAQLKADVAKGTAILTELHADMVAQKAAKTLISSAVKYLVWFVAGIATLFGSTNGHIVAQWIKDFPTAH